jgi:hypothetical protein
MNYEQRLRVLAEKMAKSKHNSNYEQLNSEQKKWAIEYTTPLAAIALQDSAELTEQAYIDGYSDGTTNTDMVKEYAKNYINSLGLVPDKTK